MFNTSHLKDEKLFLSKLSVLADSLGVSVNSLLGVMWIESKIRPNAINLKTNAVGLIQFMPATLLPWGYTSDQVRNMGALEQIDLMKLYFKPYKGRINSFLDLYLCVFYPAALGRGDAWQLPKNVATYNPAFKNSDGVVTVDSIKNKLRALLPEAAKSLISNYFIPIALCIALGIGIYIYKKK